MPTLLLTLFLLQLCIHLINTIGASTIDESFWNLATRLHPSLSSRRATQDKLRADVVRLKREMAATSAQDNFAAWARLRREHDKAMARHDEMGSTTSSTKSRFTTYASVTRWLATNGLRLFLQFWHARTAVFRLPVSALSSDPAAGAATAAAVGIGGQAGGKGWAPRILEWLVGFPRVKERGGVSVQVWGWVCVVVVGLLVDGTVAMMRWGGVLRQPREAGTVGRDKSGNKALGETAGFDKATVRG